MKIIYSNQEEEIFVDNEDFEMLSKYTWCLHNGFATTNIRQHNGKWKTHLMHRMIMNVTDPKIIVDHIDGNKSDNRRHNLRRCSQSEIKMGRSACKKNPTGIKGLSYHKPNNQWRVYIGLNGKIYSKAFACKKHPDAKEKAIQWLKETREKLHGEFAQD